MLDYYSIWSRCCQAILLKKFLFYFGWILLRFLLGDRANARGKLNLTLFTRWYSATGLYIRKRESKTLSFVYVNKSLLILRKQLLQHRCDARSDMVCHLFGRVDAVCDCVGGKGL